MAYGDPYKEPDEEAPPPDTAPPPIGVIPGAGGAPAPTTTADPVLEGQGGGHHHGGGGGADPGPQFNWPGLPGFVAPQFVTPTMEQALKEPGYEFRLGAGSDALQRSAAARGVLRSGGTLRDLLEYGQKFGAQEYSNVFNRELQSFDRKYQAAKDAFAPRLAQYQLQGQGALQAALAVYANQHKGGGGGGGAPYIPPDILGPPPVPPDYAQYQVAGGGGGAAQPYSAGDDDEFRQFQQY